MHPLSLHLTPTQQAAATAVGVAALTCAVWFALRRTRPDPEAVERARRERLAAMGRITDGSLVDTTTLDGGWVEEAGRHRDDRFAPQMLRYCYRIAGVDYEAVQDVSAIPNQVRDLRIDLPVQVRYDVKNPADSIVVAESWCGLRFHMNQFENRRTVERETSV